MSTHGRKSDVLELRTSEHWPNSSTGYTNWLCKKPLRPKNSEHKTCYIHTQSLFVHLQWCQKLPTSKTFLLCLSMSPDHHSDTEHICCIMRYQQIVIAVLNRYEYHLGAVSLLEALQIHNVPSHKAISHAVARWNEAAWYTKSVSMATVLRNRYTTGGHFGEGPLPVIMHNHGGHISQTWPASLINAAERRSALSVVPVPAF